MRDTAIQVDNLSKQFYIGRVHNNHETLRDALANAIKSPFRRRMSSAKNGTVSRVEGLKDSEETLWALREISFEVKVGEVIGVIGRNGAGKSTLLKILSRITEPTMGKAIVYGRVGSLLEVGTGFHPELTGRENVFLNGAILGMSRKDINRKFDDIVEFAEISRFLDMPVKRYSSGMYVRLAFAVAAYLEPEILFVDEVLAVGDAAFQKKCLGKMDDVAREGRTILFVSHNMNAIQRLCPKSIMLESGRLVQYEDTSRVIARYLSTTSGTMIPEQWIDLFEAGHIGTGEAQFSRLWYSSMSDASGRQPYSGGPLNCRLVVMSDQPRSVGSIAITIYDQYGTKLVNADTVSLGKMVRLSEGENSIQFLIKRLYLNPGIYVLGLWLANPAGDVFDTIHSAAKIEVVDLETENVGTRPRADGLVPCDFEVPEAL